MTTQTLKETSHTRAVEAAFAEAGFEKLQDKADDANFAKRHRTQIFRLDNGGIAERTVVQFHVTFSRDGYVTAYSSGYGGTSVREKDGRQGGVWQPRLGSKACLELLLSNLQDSLTNEYGQYLTSRERADSWIA